jgi:hypothetical protein
MKKKIISLLAASSALPILMAGNVMAHCPLCTAGAAVAAGGAMWMGVSKIVIGMFIGAFAVSMGLWFGRMVKKQYVPFQKTLIVALSFLLTVLPIIPLVTTIYPLQIYLAGGYGSLLNRIYIVDLALIASLFGGAIVTISPGLSKKITKLRGKTIPYQGVALTMLLLVAFGAAIQLMVI